MDPKQLREALNRTGIAEFMVEEETLPTHVSTVRDAAKWALGLVEDCENCKGKGVLGGCSKPNCDHAHTFMFCPSCEGRGFSLNQERLGRFLARWAVEDEPPYSARVGDFIRGDQSQGERDAGKAALRRADEEAEQRNLALAEAAILAFLFGETRQEGER